MLIVVEPGARSIETAGRIAELARQIDIHKFGAVINKAGGGVKDIEDKLKEYDIPVISVIPFDSALVQADMDNIAPVDTGGPAILAIKTIFEKLSEGYQ
jgi:CO dehydrogenase maturation factor